MIDDLIIGSRCSSGFPQAVSVFLREEAATIRAVADRLSGSPWGGRGQALDALAQYVSSLTVDDQLLRVVCVAHIARGGRTDAYAPGPVGSRMLGVLGVDRPPPSRPRDVLAELAAASTDDLVRHLDSERRKMDEARAHAQEQLAQVEALRGQIGVLEAELADVRAALDQANTTGAELRQENSFFRRLHEPEEAAKAAPRRTVVPGHEGVYSRITPSGETRYEIGYKDVDGSQRWQAVEGGLQEAIAQRAQRVAEVREARLVRS